MSEKVEIEFKFKIGDTVKDKYSGESFVVEKQEWKRDKDDSIYIWYYGSSGCGREENLIFAELPLTIKEVLERVQENGFRSNPTGCSSCELTNQILRRGIVP